MKNAVRLMMILSSLYMIGCAAGSDSVTSELLTPPVSEEPVIEYDAFKNWDFEQDQFDMDFRDYGLNNDFFMLFDMYGDWRGNVNIHVRRCRADIRFEGTRAQGTMTVTNSHMIWRIEGTEPDIYCPNYNGVYEYEATAEGLLFGLQGEEPDLYLEL